MGHDAICGAFKTEQVNNAFKTEQWTENTKFFSRRFNLHGSNKWPVLSLSFEMFLCDENGGL